MNTGTVNFAHHSPTGADHLTLKDVLPFSGIPTRCTKFPEHIEPRVGRAPTSLRKSPDKGDEDKVPVGSRKSQVGGNS